MVASNINEYLSDANCIGIVENVDTRKIIVGAENEEVLNSVRQEVKQLTETFKLYA